MLQTPTCSGIPAPTLWMNCLTAPPGLLTGRCTDSKEMHSEWVKMKWMSACHSGGGKNNKPLSRRSNLMRWISTWPGFRTCWNVNRPKWVVCTHIQVSLPRFNFHPLSPVRSSASAEQPAGGGAEASRAADQQAEGATDGQTQRERTMWDHRSHEISHICWHSRYLQKPHNIHHLAFSYAAIEVLNFPPGGRGKREQPVKSFRSTAKYVHCYSHCRLIAACWVCVLGTFSHRLACSLHLADEKTQLYVWCWSAEKLSSGRQWSCVTASPLYSMHSELIWRMWVKHSFG